MSKNTNFTPYIAGNQVVINTINCTSNVDTPVDNSKTVMIVNCFSPQKIQLQTTYL